MSSHKNKSVICRMVNAGKRIYVAPKKRDFPCCECEEGEMIHISTIPGYKESMEIWECDACGNTQSFP